MTSSVSVGKPASLPFEIRRVPMRQSLQWLSRGWDDLKQIGRAGLAHGVLIAILGAVLLMLGSSHLYLTAAAVTGYLLVGPVMTTGLCELARRRAAHEPLGFDESLQGLTRNPDGLMHFGGSMLRCRVSRSRCGAGRLMSARHRSWATRDAAPCSRALFL